MTKDEYINQAVKSIKNKRDKRLAAEEISDHIDDRIGFYTDCGYDYETSLQKAIGQMGDPEDVGEKLGKVHTNSMPTIMEIIFGLICQALALIILYQTGGADYFNIYLLMQESALAFLMLTGLAISIKNRTLKITNYINFIISAELILFFMINLISNISQYIQHTSKAADIIQNLYIPFRSIVTAFYCIVSGNSRSLAAANELYEVNVSSIPITVLSLIFFIGLMMILIKNCLILFKYNSAKFTEKDLKNNNYNFILCNGIICLVAVTLISSAIVVIFSDAKSDNFWQYTSFYLIESDEPVDFKSFDYSNARYFSLDNNGGVFDYSLLEHNSDESFSRLYKDTAELPLKGLNYQVITAEIYHEPHKRYVAIVPVFDSFSYKEDLSDPQWYDTQGKDQITCCIRDCDYPQMKYVINLR